MTEESAGNFDQQQFAFFADKVVWPVGASPERIATLAIQNFHHLVVQGHVLRYPFTVVFRHIDDAFVEQCLHTSQFVATFRGYQHRLGVIPMMEVVRFFSE